MDGNATADRPDSDDEVPQDAIADAQAAIDEARRRVAEVPAEVVVTNHVMGLYELAAIHLSSQPPDLRSAALAIHRDGPSTSDSCGIRESQQPDGVSGSWAHRRRARPTRRMRR